MKKYFLCKIRHNTIRVKKYFVLKNKSILEPSLFGVLIQANSVYCGIHLTDIQLPDQCAFLGILRESKVISAIDNPSIFAEDYILAIATHPMMVPALKVTLKKIHSVYYSLNSCLLEARPTASQSVNSDDLDLSSSFNTTYY
ncbi:MAG: potassium transporter TrkA [Nostoc sp.]|uniref:potassium transporter TrkA n=1 Tax=Nostoc sp. TaxID=1180 RepID=UPI002FF06F17